MVRGERELMARSAGMELPHRRYMHHACPFLRHGWRQLLQRMPPMNFKFMSILSVVFQGPRITKIVALPLPPRKGKWESVGGVVRKTRPLLEVLF